MKKLARALTAASLSLSVFAGCSLEPRGYTHLSLEIKPSKRELLRQKRRALQAHSPLQRNLAHLLSAPAGGRDALSSFLIPSTASEFNCFAVNVVGEGIPATDATYLDYSYYPNYCTYPGASSSIVKASTGSVTLELDVPSGADRTIQVVGMQTSSGACPSGQLGSHYADSTVTDLYELGRTVTDVFYEGSVSINSGYDPSNPKSPWGCREFKYYAYTVNATSNLVYSNVIDMTTGTLTSATTATVASPTTPVAIAADPKGRFVWVANATTVQAYKIAPTTGVLTASGSALTIGSGNKSLTVEPYGEFVYLASNTSNQVFSLSINQTTGVLTSVGPITAGGTREVAADPTGQFVYSLNSTPDLFSFNIGATGLLNATGITNPQAPYVGTPPTSMAMDPYGYFLYYADTSGTDGINGSLMEADGSLTDLGMAALGSPYSSLAMLTNFDTGEQWLYALDASFPSIDVYTIDYYTGDLVFQEYIDISATGVAKHITIDPINYYLYLTNNTNGVTVYNVDYETGNISDLGTKTTGTGAIATVVAEVGQ